MIYYEGDWIDLLINTSQEENVPYLETKEKNKVQDIETSIKKKINILSDIIIHQEYHEEKVNKATEQLNLSIEDSIEEAGNLVFEKVTFKGNEDDIMNCDEILIDDEKENICPFEDEVKERDMEENEKDITTRLQTSPTTVTSIPENIPTPFKSALFWPEISKKNSQSKRSKEKIPTVVTSVQWKEYYQKKEEEKKRKDFELNERKRKRAEKAKEKLLKKKKTTTNEQKPEPKINVTNQTLENITYKKDSFVIVKYDEDYFPGKILNVTDKQVRVNVMLKSSRNGWKWPNTPDVLWYEKMDVMREISEPTKLNNRGIYAVEEMKHYVE
ncbi:unnamed protein product [Brassicogethes aeneus]|uniref:Uncharacterized protein n=1 Tax=Brassicogethes aeneus TaxID=1431903 RepID=A0A9P0B1V7_BRAAE|nr:unnamed protein product [Brassicogethes aeneus]